MYAFTVYQREKLLQDPTLEDGWINFWRSPGRSGKKLQLRVLRNRCSSGGVRCHPPYCDGSMDILHQLVDGEMVCPTIHRVSTCFNHPRWCRISSSNRCCRKHLSTWTKEISTARSRPCNAACHLAPLRLPGRCWVMLGIALASVHQWVIVSHQTWLLGASSFNRIKLERYEHLWSYMDKIEDLWLPEGN